MKVSEALFYPYSRAQMHFKEAAHSEWKGRTVHYVVGAFECIPIFNYLVLLVDLAVKAIFKKSSEVPTRPIPEVELSTLSFEDFVKRFGISFETPLQLKLREIQKSQALWTQGKEDFAWSRRMVPMRKTIGDLLPFVDNEALKNLLQNRELSPYKFYEELKSICARLIETEQEKADEKRQIALQAFHQIRFPVIESVDAYVGNLGFRTPADFRTYYDVQQTLLSTRGIKTIIDLDCLGLRAWDDDLFTLKGFQCLLKQGIGQDQCATYRNELQAKLKQDVPISIPLDENIWNQDMDSFVHQFEEFVLLRQKELLKTYLNQNRGHEVWELAKDNPNMGLQDFCQLHEIQIPSGCYSLGIVLEK